MHANAVEDLLTSFQTATGPSGIWESAATFFGSYGFDRIIYLDVGPVHERVLTTMPDAWMAHYTERNHARIDPFMRYCAATLDPVGTGIDFLDDHAYLDPRERGFIREAAETGFRAGMTCMIRVKGPMGAAGWNLGSTMPREQLETVFAEHGNLLRLAAHFSHEKLSRSDTGAEASTRALSVRETECLQWIAGGFRTKEIADRMGIKPITVELHLRNARNKLGARTREHALARALAEGVLKL
ncbi:LuxR family transcriptional regulator [Hoeflea sp. AS60]|uniref:helix-turn-helix transcriptional regulator n=1 Tax=Hoeflea sp. AS60 TaxID=3135780 RepID=UPI00316B5CFA